MDGKTTPGAHHAVPSNPQLFRKESRMFSTVLRHKKHLPILGLSTLLAGILCMANAVSAQPVQSPDWQQVTPSGVGVSLARMSTGDYVVVGIESPLTIDPRYGAIMTLKRYGSAGQPAWSAQVTPPTLVGLKPSKVLIDAQDNIYVLANEGDYNYTICIPEDPTCTSGQIKGLFDAYSIVQKYAPGGTLLWQQQLLGLTGLVPVQGAFDPSGDLYLTWDPNPTRSAVSGRAAVVRRLNKDTGATLWSSFTSYAGVPGALALSSTGTVLVAAAGTSGLFIAEFAPDTGARLTLTTYAAAAGVYPPGMAVGPQGEVAFTGQSAEGLFLGVESAARQPAFTLSTTPGAQGRLVAVDANSQLVVAGTVPGSSGTNWLLLRYDAAGTPVHAPVVLDRHASATEAPQDLILAGGGAAYITGAAGPGTSIDPNATQAVTMRLAPSGTIDWIASAPTGVRGVDAALALDGSVAVLAAGEMTLLHYRGAGPAVPTVMTLSRSSVRGGNNVTGALTLSAPTGAVVRLTSSNPSIASVPSTLNVPGGISTANFTIKTSKVRTNTAVTITATANGVSTSAILLVTR